MCALRIVVDDGCEVPASLVAQHRIRVVPLVVRFGDEVYDDGQLSLDEFWAKARTVAHPQTSQPASGTFEGVFRELVAGGDEVLCITITSKHSGTYNSAWLAAQQFPGKVTVFDSFSIALGSGFLALKAAQAAEAGVPLPEIVSRLEACRDNMQFPILLNTIEDIRRGGRADHLIPVVERVLQVFDIKPILTFADGRLKILGTVRSYERGLARLLDLIAGRAPYQELAIFHTRQPEAALAFADRVAARVAYPRERLLVTEVGAVLATHAGPQAIGVIGVPAGT
ncbi:MAG TPA: DegV family protein [Anaerolineae bacterium]|nr:DegV family protein [Anaerolineae bacterium]HOQ98130.1 DegV family protein [Anaerolineae bacterium]HPL30233.1 DegV family protein [Anaerolineae bacterium]